MTRALNKSRSSHSASSERIDESDSDKEMEDDAKDFTPRCLKKTKKDKGKSLKKKDDSAKDKSKKRAPQPPTNPWGFRRGTMVKCKWCYWPSNTPDGPGILVGEVDKIKLHMAGHFPIQACARLASIGYCFERNIFADFGQSMVYLCPFKNASCNETWTKMDEKCFKHVLQKHLMDKFFFLEEGEFAPRDAKDDITYKVKYNDSIGGYGPEHPWNLKIGSKEQYTPLEAWKWAPTRKFNKEVNNVFINDSGVSKEDRDSQKFNPQYEEDKENWRQFMLENNATYFSTDWPLIRTTMVALKEINAINPDGTYKWPAGEEEVGIPDEERTRRALIRVTSTPELFGLFLSEGGLDRYRGKPVNPPEGWNLVYVPNAEFLKLEAKEEKDDKPDMGEVKEQKPSSELEDVKEDEDLLSKNKRLLTQVQPLNATLSALTQATGFSLDNLNDTIGEDFKELATGEDPNISALLRSPSGEELLKIPESDIQTSLVEKSLDESPSGENSSEEEHSMDDDRHGEDESKAEDDDESKVDEDEESKVDEDEESKVEEDEESHGASSGDEDENEGSDHETKVNEEVENILKGVLENVPSIERVEEQELVRDPPRRSSTPKKLVEETSDEDNANGNDNSVIESSNNQSNLNQAGINVHEGIMQGAMEIDRRGDLEDPGNTILNLDKCIQMLSEKTKANKEWEEDLEKRKAAAEAREMQLVERELSLKKRQVENDEREATLKEQELRLQQQISQKTDEYSKSINQITINGKAALDTCKTGNIKLINDEGNKALGEIEDAKKDIDELKKDNDELKKSVAARKVEIADLSTKIKNAISSVDKHLKVKNVAKEMPSSKVEKGKSSDVLKKKNVAENSPPSKTNNPKKQVAGSKLLDNSGFSNALDLVSKEKEVKKSEKVHTSSKRKSTNVDTSVSKVGKLSDTDPVASTSGMQPPTSVVKKSQPKSSIRAMIAEAHTVTKK